ncbi:MAG TPA: hypothetical protein VIU29_01395, partial [Candidatus Deferrimicrobiaceae bacterium]
RNVLRLFVRSAVDGNGDGLNDIVFMSSPPANATGYVMPPSAAAKLKGRPSLYWYVQIREQANYVVNPDMTTNNYFTYRNSGRTQPFSLP